MINLLISYTILSLLFLGLPITTFAFDLLIIDSQDGEPYKTVRESMIAELDLLGFSEDDNLNIKYWSLGNKDGKAQRVWLLEKDTHYDAIFLNGTVAAINFKKFAFRNNAYKFIFGCVTDPVGIGIIDNLNSAPKGNFTGISYPVKVDKRLRFIKKVMPNAKNIGFIYADMPQSRSYIKWINKAISQNEFNELKFHFRSVEFIKSDEGHNRMTMLAKKYVQELDSQVDLFLSPNDQMGAQEPFAKMVSETATKPLIGLGRKDVMENWGATMSIYPSLKEAGKQIGIMISRLFKGTDLRQITPEWPKYGVTFNLKKTQQFGISIPEDLVRKAEDNIIR